VADALAGARHAGRRAAAQRGAGRGRGRALTGWCELRFNNGVSSSLELLDAQRSLFAAQQAVVQTRLALLQNRLAGARTAGRAT
jgi:multidrug efflux system outer membrane protein